MNILHTVHNFFPNGIPFCSDTSILNLLQKWIHGLHMPALMIIGLMTLIAFYFGKSMRFLRLPSIIGFMIIGVLLGPSLFDLISEGVQHNFSFITEIALGFVALSIGLELSFSTLKQQGGAMILIIFAESIMAFIIVTIGVYLISGNLPLALIFGAIAPASAPAGTVAIIQEYKARGKLTSALYTVVGFDDGLGIMIFGFASAIAQSILANSTGTATVGIMNILSKPLIEIGLSFVVGILAAVIFCFLAKRTSKERDIFILIFSFVLFITGICISFHLSLILTNMILGIVIVNTQKQTLLHKIHTELKNVMPLLFILFFVLAGSNLHISALPSLGLLGLVYILARSTGLMGGAWLGATIGKADEKIRKYLGMGILSQAGVAIGLSLIVKHDFSKLGAPGMKLGATVITTVTATCIFFEIIGPVLTKIGLKKAGEIKE